MASGDEAVKIVDPADVADETPLVHVDSVQKSSLFSFFRGSKPEDTDEVGSRAPKPAPGSENKKKDESSSHQKDEHVHEGDGVKTTYDVEEDVPPSLVEQLKRKAHWNGR